MNWRRVESRFGDKELWVADISETERVHLFRDYQNLWWYCFASNIGGEADSVGPFPSREQAEQAVIAHLEGAAIDAKRWAKFWAELD